MLMPFTYFCIYSNTFFCLYCIDQREEKATIKINTTQVPNQSFSETRMSKRPIFQISLFFNLGRVDLIRLEFCCRIIR